MWLICNATFGMGKNKLLVRGTEGGEYVFCPLIKGIKRDKVRMGKCQGCRHFVRFQQISTTTISTNGGHSSLSRRTYRRFHVKRRPQRLVRGSVTTALLPRMANAMEPLIDVFEEEDCVMVIANLFGVEEEHIKLDVENNMLTIRSREINEKVVLPRPVNEDVIESAYRNGVIEVKLRQT